MPMKTIRLPITASVADPDRSTPEVKDGPHVLQHAVVATRKIPAHQPFDLDAAEADRLLNRFGGYERDGKTWREVDPDPRGLATVLTPAMAGV